MKKYASPAVLVALASLFSSIANGASIPVNVDLSGLKDASITLQDIKLVVWRNASPHVIDPSQFAFQYFQGTNLDLPNTTNVLDKTANDQGDLWSDDVLRVAYTQGNRANEAIEIYTDNKAIAPNDPLNSVALRGGVVGGGATCTNPADPCWGYRTSVLPLLWKNVSVDSIIQADTTTVRGPALPANSPFWMAKETSASDLSCPVDPDPNSPYHQGPATTRTSAGFCDYSTHYVVDKNNTDPGNLWWQNPAVRDRTGTFRYVSLIGAFGPNASESGFGGGSVQPQNGSNFAYFVLGLRAGQALKTSYSTTVFVEKTSS